MFCRIFKSFTRDININFSAFTNKINCFILFYNLDTERLILFKISKMSFSCSMTPFFRTNAHQFVEFCSFKTRSSFLPTIATGPIYATLAVTCSLSRSSWFFTCFLFAGRHALLKKLILLLMNQTCLFGGKPFVHCLLTSTGGELHDRCVRSSHVWLNETGYCY